jgi:cell wall-associated NlpC family hydrolase
VGRGPDEPAPGARRRRQEHGGLRAPVRRLRERAARLQRRAGRDRALEVLRRDQPLRGDDPRRQDAGGEEADEAARTSPPRLIGRHHADDDDHHPGRDNRAARASLVSAFLDQKSADPVSFALRARELRDIAPTSSTESETEHTPGTEPRRSASSDGSSPSSGGDLASFAKLRADAINAQGLPYKWGGGHGGQTKLSEPVPLDCSGAVSKVLGIDPRVADQFKTWGRPGDGGSKGVTVYSKPTHTLMKINGHFFGTSGSNPGGGAGWIPQE